MICAKIFIHTTVPLLESAREEYYLCVYTKYVYNRYVYNYRLYLRIQPRWKGVMPKVCPVTTYARRSDNAAGLSVYVGLCPVMQDNEDQETAEVLETVCSLCQDT